MVGDVEEGAKLFGMPLDNLTQRAEAYEKKMQQNIKFGTSIGARTMGASTSATAVGFKPYGGVRIEIVKVEMICHASNAIQKATLLQRTHGR